MSDNRSDAQRRADRKRATSANWYSDDGLYMQGINEVLRTRPASGAEWDVNDHEMLVLNMGEILYREDGAA